MKTERKSNKEEWRPADFEDWGKYYEVSNLGRVRNAIYYMPKSEKEYCQNMGYIPKPGDIRKPVLNKQTGYLQIMLIHNKRLKLVRLGRLVAMTWVNKTGNEDCTVKYKNGQYLDDRACNLYWSTSGGRINQYNPKLIKSIMNMRKKKMKLKQISKKINLSMGRLVYLIYNSTPALTDMQRLR